VTATRWQQVAMQGAGLTQTIPSNWQSTTSNDALAQETAVALVFNGVSHTVMMASPADLEDFALGFGLSEGLLASAQELYGVEVQHTEQGIALQMEVAAACEWRLKERRRTLAGRTGCGLCGTDQLDQVKRDLPAVAGVKVSLDAIIKAQAQMREYQRMQQFCGATHAAAWVDLQGDIGCVREDVGRHNALDKLIGALTRQRISPQQGFVCITSRASFEMVQKTAAWGAGMLAAVSAPTELAVQVARDLNLCLAGFVREHSLNVYTYPERVMH
jgi:FdhD protein